MFLFVKHAFQKVIITLQLNDWKSGKKIVSKTLQIWGILAKTFSIYFFMFILVTDFSKKYSNYN